jgi:hypothetical protein
MEGQDLIQYNWLNQSLIELKILIKDLILSNSSNPGTPPTGSVA